MRKHLLLLPLLMLPLSTNGCDASGDRVATARENVAPTLAEHFGKPVFIRIIKEDKASIAVFPEGYIHKEDRRLHPFRPGVFKIAQKANVPIVVCTLRDTHKALASVMKLKGADVHLHLLGVIPAEELEGKTAVQVGEQVYEMMARDLGPELVLPRTEE